MSRSTRPERHFFVLGAHVFNQGLLLILLEHRALQGFERFDKLFRAAISVLREAIVKEEEEWKRPKERAKTPI